MKVFGVIHKGIWMSGYSIIVAVDVQKARALMLEELARLKMDLEVYDIKEIDTSTQAVHMLFNGDY